jgi:hypothetical protein
MDHDPFCKAYYPDLLEVERCAWCMVIRRVREDEQTYALSAYNTGYMDGHSDAEKEFMNPCLLCGHNGFSTYICDDCKREESTNEDIEVTKVSKEDIVKRWNELFDANPWLEGMTHADSCEFIDCCPVPDPEDWTVFNEIFTLLWLGDLESPRVLTRDLIEKIGGTQ